MRTCVTHHHACDCREEKFRKMEAALAEAREGLEWYAAYGEEEFAMFDWRGYSEARTTLSTIDAMLSGDERKEEG